MNAFSFLEFPAIHPQILSSPLATWPKESKSMYLDEILCPGLPAELYHSLKELPVQPTYYDEGPAVGMSWRCSFQVPPKPDPQHAESLYRLHRFLDQDLPLMVRALTGQKLKSTEPGNIHLVILRKGSFLQLQGIGPTHWGFLVSLTPGEWPISWGGQIICDEVVHSPGWNRLHLFQDDCSLSVLHKHVEVLLVMGWLEMEP